MCEYKGPNGQCELMKKSFAYLADGSIKNNYVVVGPNLHGLLFCNQLNLSGFNFFEKVFPKLVKDLPCCQNSIDKK